MSAVRSGAARARETGHINRSLFTLGNVCEALYRNATAAAAGKAASTFVPFRDSKLTRLMQNAFGGNARTTLVLNCSTDVADATESLATLRFGARAACIKNTPKVNVSESVDVLREPKTFE